MELRCDSKKHGELLTKASGVLEVTCNSQFCGNRSGVIVLHQFDLSTGLVMGTKRYNTNTRSK